jgi:hypothetical protein
MNRSWHEPFDGRRVPLAALLAAVIAVGVNLGLREAGDLWLGVPKDQPVLSLVSVVAATLVAVFAASVAITFLGQTQPRPFTAFRRLAAIVFLISCVGPLLAFAGWLPGVDTVSTATMALLLGMNAATAVICVVILGTMPRARMPRHRF